MEARAALTVHGLSYTDDRGMVRARPEVAVERDAAPRICAPCARINLDRLAIVRDGVLDFSPTQVGGGTIVVALACFGLIWIALL